MSHLPQAPSSKRGYISTAYLSTRRFAVFASAAAALYFGVGCWMYGEWWFGLIWGKQFRDPDYITDGLGFLLNERFYLLLGMVIALFVGGCLAWVYRQRVLSLVDKVGTLVLFGSSAMVVITALILYRAERDSVSWETEADFTRTLEVMEGTKRGIRNSIGPPVLSAPIDFHYLDKERVDGLFSQIQSTLVEKERTVSTTDNVRGKVGAVAGPLSAEGEAGKSASLTSSFSRTEFSSEKKCIEVVNYLIESNTPPQYYRNRDDWLLRQANADYWRALERLRMNPGDRAAISGIRPLTDKASPDEKEEAERKAQQYQQSLVFYLKSSGFAVVDGTFDISVSGNDIILLERFSAKPRVVFRAKLPKSALPDVTHEGSIQLKLFGDVIRPLDGDGYVDLRPIAIF
jgi:hypothetical protein